MALRFGRVHGQTLSEAVAVWQNYCMVTMAQRAQILHVPRVTLNSVRAEKQQPPATADALVEDARPLSSMKTF